MTQSLWFRQAVAVLAEKGHIEVNLVPKHEKWFRREYRRRVGRYPAKNAYNVATNPDVKKGSQLRVVLDSSDTVDRRIVERGLGIKLGAGAGGKGYRKGSKDLCMKLIAAGLDIGRRPPHRGTPTVSDLQAEAQTWEKNAKEYLEGFRAEITREVA